MAKVYRLLVIGLTLEEAALVCGVHKATLCRWKERGEEATKGIHHDFCELVKRARAEAQGNWLEAIEKVAKGEKATRIRRRYSKGQLVEEVEEEYYLITPQWTAAAWKLERYNPERWGRQVPLVQVSQQTNTQVTHVQQLALEAQQLTGAELERQLIELRKEQDDE